MTEPSGQGRGLLVDYGGVLTGSLGRSFETFERDAGLEEGTVIDMLLEAYEGEDGGVIGRVERGEMGRKELSEFFAERLVGHGGEVQAQGLLSRLLPSLEADGDFWKVVAHAREQGIRTGLLSNSWGVDGYPRERLEQHFDVLVISGEVGLRKPDPRIFHLAAEQLGLPVERIAFVDDFHLNVEAAEKLGMHGIVYHHGSFDEHLADLSAFLGVDLSLAS